MHEWSDGDDGPEHDLDRGMDQGLDHCRSLSSAENSFCEAEHAETAESGGPVRTRSRGRAPLPFSSLELQSSGYASIHCSSSSPTCSYSALVPCAIKDLPTDATSPSGSTGASVSPGFRLLVPMQRPAGFSCKQVKRKNAAAHSGGEMEVEEAEREGGFLSL